MTKHVAIVNTERPEAIGDAVSAFPAVRALADQDRVMVHFSSGPVRPLFGHPNAVVLDCREPECEVFDVQQVAKFGQLRGMGLAQSWFAALGLPVPPQGPLDFGISVPTASVRFDIVLAPFSASDAGGCKTWPDERWTELISRIDRCAFTVACGRDDELPAWCHGGGFATMRDFPLRAVCTALANARCVLTVDNGVSWLAQAVRARHVLLQPSNHPAWWTPDMNPGAVNLPDVRNVPVEVVLAVMRNFLSS